jgi:hypothetical protein
VTRELCSVTRTDGTACDYVAGHPSDVHVTWIDGWPHQWSTFSPAWGNIGCVPKDPLTDAPEALKE